MLLIIEEVCSSTVCRARDGAVRSGVEGSRFRGISQISAPTFLCAHCARAQCTSISSARFRRETASQFCDTRPRCCFRQDQGQTRQNNWRDSEDVDRVGRCPSRLRLGQLDRMPLHQPGSGRQTQRVEAPQAGLPLRSKRTACHLSQSLRARACPCPQP